MEKRVPRSSIAVHPVWAVTLLGTALLLATGCAQQNAAIATQPTPEELPVLERTEPPIAANVIVEGRPAVPHHVLVPKLEPPELTPAQKEALGEKPLTYKFLPYNQFWLFPGSLVGPWYGGVTTAIDKYLNISALGAPHRPLAGVAGWGGAAAGVDPIAASVSSTYTTNTSLTIAGTASLISEVQVATDPTASKVAQRQEYREH